MLVLLAAPLPLPAAIDFYCTVDKVQGKQGENRVVITFNGKVRPEDNSCAGWPRGCRLRPP